VRNYKLRIKKITIPLKYIFDIFILMKNIGLLILLLLSACSSVGIKQNLSGLPVKKFTQKELSDDFDLLISALKEAHTGLYTYSTKSAFDSIAAIQRKKITNGLNSVEFYNITAPVVAFTKEDHCDIAVSKEASDYLKQYGKYLPLTVISLNKNIYILNNIGNLNIKGHRLLLINSNPIEDIYRHIFTTFAADGYIETSKYRMLDHFGLAREYSKTIAQPDHFEILVKDPVTRKQASHIVKGISFKELVDIEPTLITEGLLKTDLPPAKLEINNDIAVLTLNTFSNSSYREAGLNFKEFVHGAFDTIRKRNIKNLIIDIRENGGGSEGNEDYLFSFLTAKEYNKYKYVQASAFSYSFYQFTDYNSPEGIKEFEDDLKKEHYLADDGRILRKPGIEEPTPLQQNPFNGDVYILTSGWTYSGGAEFCSLMREHTKAIFIGEETGGGFYGNTSGYSLELTLPNTALKIDIPILKFVLDVSDKVPPGRGVIPDYEVQPGIKELLSGIDAEMEFAKQLIKQKKS
jgi:hypothetical protein